MKRNFFSKYFNVFTKILFVFTLSILIKLIISKQLLFILNLNWIVNLIITSCLLILTPLVFIEIQNRLKDNSLYYLFKSIFMTMKLRFFKTKTINKENTSANTNTIRLYNKAIKSMVVDINYESIVVSIKKPLDSDACKLLLEEARDLKMAIMIDDPSYIFTREPTEMLDCLIIEGTRIPS